LDIYFLLVKTKIQALLNEISALSTMERGKLTILREGPKGPYYSHQSWENGKNVCRYVPAKEVATLRESIANYQRYQDITDQYAKEVINRTRAQKAEHEKKDSSRQLPSPKTSKSAN
jgi:hypothetical protein